jgi:phage tail sheath protein FI
VLAIASSCPRTPALGRLRHAVGWKFVSVCRTVLFLETSIGEGMQWAVFEPNDAFDHP